MIVLIITLLVSVIGLLKSKFQLRKKSNFPFIYFKQTGDVSFGDWFLIGSACVTCVVGITQLDSSNIREKSAESKQASLHRELTKKQETIVELTRNNYKGIMSGYEHSTRIKDCLNRKIDTLEHQNFLLSEQQFKSFDSTYKKIAQSAENLEAAITGKGGYCFAEMVV